MALLLNRALHNDTWQVSGLTDEQLDILHGFAFAATEVQDKMREIAEMLRPKDPKLGVLDNLEREPEVDEAQAMALALLKELATITDPAMR